MPIDDVRQQYITQELELLKIQILIIPTLLVDLAQPRAKCDVASQHKTLLSVYLTLFILWEFRS